uniref:GTP diphosphokinase n=1 Tax=Picea sitchensis TaxID=3332 RepID=A9NX25_PICSI|nr:unknown [Picea sitchensis]
MGILQRSTCLHTLPSIYHTSNKTNNLRLLLPLQHRLKLKNFIGKHQRNNFVKKQRSITCESRTKTEYVLAKNECGSSSVIELPGGKMVVELVAAWNDLTDRMNPISSKSSELLLKALKITIPLLQSLPCGEDGRPPLSKALSVACILADLQVEAEVIVVCLLRELLEAGAISRHEINLQLGRGITHLLHDCLRVKKIPTRVDILDDDNAYALRKFCLAYHDIRAVIVEVAARLDMMRHSKHLPKYCQQTLALDVMQVYAPLAHAIGTGSLSLELEDLAFQSLFPNSYSFVDTWLRNHGTWGEAILNEYRCQLFEALQKDYELEKMVDKISIQGRYKSHFSTMKKLLKDGRKPEEVYDILGLRVVLNPRPGKDAQEIGRKVCYRAREVIQSLWKEVPQRMKDYVAKPKKNGYESLHLTIDLNDSNFESPSMEIQIRTAEMDAKAVGGDASHGLYKGGLTDPEQVKQLKAIMMAAADLAAFHFQGLPKRSSKGSTMHNDMKSRIFKLFDKNQDGLISMEELKEMMEELGANKEDAQ